MSVCPICEHRQEFGLECEVCGKDLGDLGGLGPPPVAAERVEGLEVTVPERVGEVQVDLVGELEATAFEGAQGPVGADVMPDLDTGRSANVGLVSVERIADLAQDRAVDDGVRTAAPTGAVMCRYCRNVQASGLICNTCGMRLPKPAPPQPTQASGSNVVYSRGDARCKACGAPATPAQRCSECGALTPLPA
jgi:hypothetical protein